MQITQEQVDPITPEMRGDMQMMTDAWLRWGDHVASSGRIPVGEPDVFYKSFPHLNDTNHEPTSHAYSEPKSSANEALLRLQLLCVRGGRPERSSGGLNTRIATGRGRTAKKQLKSSVWILRDEYGYEPCGDGKYENGVQKGGNLQRTTCQCISRFNLRPAMAIGSAKWGTTWTCSTPSTPSRNMGR